MTVPEDGSVHVAVPAPVVTPPVETPPAPVVPPVEAVVTPPIEPVIPPVVPPVIPPVVPAVSPVEQLQALTIDQLSIKLAEQDTAIAAVGIEKTRLQNEQLLTAGEKERLTLELATAITDRTAIDTELKKREVELGSQLVTQTAATQTATALATDTQAQLTEERSRRVKLEIILTEFPDLAGYAEIIQPNEDPAKIRAHCQVIKSANEKALATQRQILATGAPAITPTTPPRVDATVDPARIDAYLREGMKEGPVEYEKRRKLVLDQLAGVHPQA